MLPHVNFGVAYDQEVTLNLVLRIMLWVSLTIWKAPNLTQIDGKTKETHTQHQEVLRCARGKFSILQESVIKSKFYIEMVTKKISAVSIAQINICEYAMYLGAFNLCVVKCWLCSIQIHVTLFQFSCNHWSFLQQPVNYCKLECPFCYIFNFFTIISPSLNPLW